MAEMLIDGAKLNACMTAEANAIRTKTGGSTDIAFDYANNKGFADAIAAIETGGGVTTQPLSVTENGTYTAPSGTAYTPVTVNVPTGGSLPSVISKIDGGEFTLASDTQASRYAILHNLGIVPKQIILWTEDATLRDSYDTLPERYIMWASYMLWPWVHNATTSYGGSPFYIYRGTSGSTGNTGSPTSSTSSVTSSAFSFASTMFYKAGVTYKWLVFA